MENLVVLDVETLPNYWLIAFKGVDTGKLLTFEAYGEHASLSADDIAKIKQIMKTRTTFGFNSNKYDLPMIRYALSGARCNALHKLSVKLIEGNAPSWMVMKDLDLPELKCDHFDICEPSPAVMISLKAYGTRIGSKKLWEFFVDPHLPIDRETADRVRDYCENDLDVTIDLFNEIKPEIELRVFMSSEYDTDLRSKSGAQVAEAILLKETGYNGDRPSVPATVSYKAPPCVQFVSEQLRELKDGLEATRFAIKKANGSPIEPDWMRKSITTLGKTKYKIGLGGIHDKRTKSVYTTNNDFVILDVDVESYYPSMIIEFGYSPRHIGKKFYQVYKKIYTDRLQAKRNKDKNKDKSLKLVLNSAFGKMGSMYSKLYAPDVMLQVTITGQLMLLMLIEQIELQGVEVFYANTDGITMYCPRDKVELIEVLIFDWELVTGMVMETTEFKRTCIRDVNNFVNITANGDVKAKGVYAETSLSKGLQTPIVFEAVRKYILDGTPIEQTIRGCKVVNHFLAARTVKGGAMWRGEYLGKMVRWYYSTDGASINYKLNGNLVPKTGDGVHPMMDLTDTLPSNLNYDWYVNEAVEMLKDLGVDYGNTAN